MTSQAPPYVWRASDDSCVPIVAAAFRTGTITEIASGASSQHARDLGWAGVDRTTVRLDSCSSRVVARKGIAMPSALWH